MAAQDGQRVEDVEQELYAVPPEDFVALRDRLVAQARDAGDAALAKQVGALRKPTAGAWLANLLSREHPDQVGELVALGAALREAQEGLDATQLRELGRQRHQVVAALVGLARRTAAEQGHPAGAAAASDLEGTLTAALADPAAAQALQAGRLAHGLTYAGLGSGASAQPSGPTRGAAGAQPRTGPKKKAAAAPEPKPSPEAARAAKVDAAERDLAQARLQAAAAQADADEAVQSVSTAMQALKDARSEVQRLSAELTAAEREVARREAEREAAVREKVRTARLASGAVKDAERAAKAVEKLVAG